MEAVKVRKNKEGRVDTEEEDIVSGLILTESDYHRLMNALTPELTAFSEGEASDVDETPEKDPKIAAAENEFETRFDKTRFDGNQRD